MITLAHIAELRPVAEHKFLRAYDEVCRIARRASEEGFAAVVELDAAKRELEVLDKMKMELVSAGRSETPFNAPQAVSAPVTPSSDFGAL